MNVVEGLSWRCCPHRGSGAGLGHCCRLCLGYERVDAGPRCELVSISTTFVSPQDRHVKRGLGKRLRRDGVACRLVRSSRIYLAARGQQEWIMS